MANFAIEVEPDGTTEEQKFIEADFRGYQQQLKRKHGELEKIKSQGTIASGDFNCDHDLLSAAFFEADQ